VRRKELPDSQNTLYQLVGPQPGIWHADQISETGNAFVVAQYVEINGPLNIDLFSRAVSVGLSEADTVHSRYFSGSSTVFQEIPVKTPVESVKALEVIDLESMSNPNKSALEIMHADFTQELRGHTDTCLYRQILFKLPTNNNHPQWLWYQRYHHLMIDGYSFTILTKRISEIYTALCKQVTTAESPFTSFVKVIEEFRQYETSDKITQDKEFWQKYVDQLIKPTTLSKVNFSPIDTINSEVIRYKIDLNRKLLASIGERPEANRLSLTDLICSVIMTYLAKMNCQQKVSVGFPMMRRMGSIGLKTSGPLVNILPLQLQVDRSKSLYDIALLFSRELRNIRKHQRYEAEQIQRDLGLLKERQRLYGPVINCKIFDYQLDFDGISGTTHQLATGPIEDIEFSIYLDNDRLHLELAANANRYNIRELELHCDRLENLFHQLSKLPNSSIGEIALLSQKEENLIKTWSAGPQIKNHNNYKTVLDIFDNQALRQGETTAINFHGTSITYSELSVQASKLCVLLQEKNISNNDIVAVALPRSIDSIVAILAILRCGATYMPIDLSLPEERIAVICADAEPAQIITLSQIQYRLPKTHVFFCLDTTENREALSQNREHNYTSNIVSPDQRAYLFYTSGSTGEPKGVMVPHGALLNLMLALQDDIYRKAFSVNTKKSFKVALTGSFSFDTSWDPILLMLMGNELFLFNDKDKQDAIGLIHTIRHKKINALAVAPSLATQLLDAGLMDDGHHHPTLIDICGEAVSPALWAKLQEYPQLQAHNIYGPTEFTVYATSARVRPEASTPSIGRPLGNIEVYVLDEKLKPVPIGVFGELYLAGDNMTSGYLKRPATTASRFVANPFVPGEVMYITGDLVRWNTEGELEFIGRSDNQVKIRGHRIELGDIEAALSSLPQIKEVAVKTVSGHSGNQLIAFYTLRDSLSTASSPEQIQSILTRKLPTYMLPSSMVPLKEFPLTVSGKIDKKALIVPVYRARKTSRPAKNDHERAICDTVVEVLQLTRVNAEDDFFKLGGDSISAMKLSTKLYGSGLILKPQDIFMERTPEKMAEKLQDSKEESTTYTSNSIKELSDDLAQKYGNVSAVLPALPLQAGLLFHAQLEDQTSNYSFTTRLDLHGPVDSARLRKALKLVIQKHPQLAATFDLSSSAGPLQIIPDPNCESTDWPWVEYNLSSFTPQKFEKELQRLENVESNRSYDLNCKIEEKDPLLHTTLIHTPSGNHILLVTAHHLIIDGWSTPVLIQDLLHAYRDQKLPFTNDKDSYERIVTRLTSRNSDSAQQFWQKQLQGVTPTLIFGESHATEQIGELEVTLDQDLSKRLADLCRKEGVTFNTLIQGVWGALISSMAGHDDVVFGSPVSGRANGGEDIDQVIGLFSNTLPVRVQLRPQLPLLQQLRDHQEQQVNLMEHDGLGLSEIQRIAGTDTLFDTLLVVENYPADESLYSQKYDGICLAKVKNRGFTHYPLTILVLPGKEIRILFEYRDAVSNAKQLSEQFLGMLVELAEQPHLPLCQMSLISAEEDKLLYQLNRTSHDIPSVTLRDLLSEQIKRTPQAIALRDSEKSLSYQEIYQQSQRLAGHLAELGSQSGKIIAIAVERSVELSLALQAVIYCGAAYLPLDMEYPDERLAYMLSDAHPTAILTNVSTANRLQNLLGNDSKTEILSVDALLAEDSASGNAKLPALAPQDPAYLIYTSGSTGQPKGVLVSHEAIVNRLLWMQTEYALDYNDVVLQKTPSSFDVSVWEFFWPLITGAELVMAPPGSHREPQQLLQLIKHYGVTTLHFVPSMLAILLDHMHLEKHSDHTPATSSLRHVFCSGEALSYELVSIYSKYYTAPLHNLYGPTEAAVDVSYFPALEKIEMHHEGGVPIGKPVWNTQLRVLDHQLRPVGVGISGELYLGGIQLANGYLNRESQTATRFVADPFADGKRMYRTGDIVRWLPNGNLEYLGRSDDQLKIRGQRIEIGEIEQALNALPGVRQAVVHARKLQKSKGNEDSRQLIGYIIPEGGDHAQTQTKELLAKLKKVLPSHMVPFALVVMDAFPLSANGKLDRKSLPDPEKKSQAHSRALNLGTEQIVAECFQKLLDRENIQARDNFFELGGHSLLAMRLAAELRQVLSVPVTVGQIMVSPTVEELAAVLANEKLRKDPEKAGFGTTLPIRTGQGAHLFCINPGSGFSWQYTGFPRYLNGQWPIVGLQSPRPNGPVAVSSDMEEVVEYYLETLLQVQPNGPYHLMGYSFGGTVALALASKLSSRGSEVAFIGLFDTYPPEGQEWKRPTEDEAREEVEREKQQFLQAAQGEFADAATLQEQTSMFDDIVANYDDAVRLLSGANTEFYSGQVHLFVAEKTLPEGWDVQESWAPYLTGLVQHSLPFAHDDILSPEALNTLGPLLNQILSGVPSLTDTKEVISNSGMVPTL